MSLSPASLAGLLIAALGAGLLVGWLLAVVRGARRARDAEIRAAQLEVRLATELRTREQLDAERAAALDLLRAQFDGLAGASLRSNNDVFLKLAREHLGQHQQAAASELAARQQAIAGLVQPMREALARTEQQLGAIEKERATTFGALRASLESVTLAQQALQKETRTLVNSLRRPEVRGRWGEITLRRLAELAGMVEHCDFSEQVHTRDVTGTGGSLRPDMVVHMPDGRDLVVDVKTPLDAYLEATEAVDEDLRAAALRRHAQIVGERIRQLAAKSYWQQFARSPDFVILFIPGDQFLSAALAENPGLLEEGMRQNVILATPTSLVALLKAVAYGWRQNALADNAATIRRLAEDLYRRLGAFTGHLQKLGRHLNSSVEVYNSAVGSLERSVLPGARRFTELGVQPDRPIAPLDAVESLGRMPAGAAESAGESDNDPGDDPGSDPIEGPATERPAGP